MKRSCENCKALGLYPIKCDLGYKIIIKTLSFVEVSAKPLEQCPKPRTIKEYFRLAIGGSK